MLSEIEDVREIDLQRLKNCENLPISVYSMFVEDDDPLAEYLTKQATDDEGSDEEDIMKRRKIGKKNRLEILFCYYS